MSSSANASAAEQKQNIFRAVKPPCVSLLRNASLRPENVKVVKNYLDVLDETLSSVPFTDLNSNLASYIFYPLSQILQRNPSDAIPDSILEKIARILRVLSEYWWWYCDIQFWEQLLILSFNLLCETQLQEPSPPKTMSNRDSDCFVGIITWSTELLRPRDEVDCDQFPDLSRPSAERRFQVLKDRARLTPLSTIVGTALNKALTLVLSSDPTLQRSSLHLISVIIEHYMPQNIAPTILPGVVSTAAKLALGNYASKGWVHGDIVQGALKIIQTISLNAISDEVCLRDGLVSKVNNLEDLVNASSDAVNEMPHIPSTPVPVVRTAIWLRGTATQLHIALNSLVPLLRHVHHKARLALAFLFSEMLRNAVLTMPNSQQLFLEVLLSLSYDSSDEVAKKSFSALTQCLEQDDSLNMSLIHQLLRIGEESLRSISTAMRFHNELKVQILAQRVVGICRVGIQLRESRTHLRNSLTQSFNPAVHIEKWGWSLLQVLEIRLVQHPVQRIASPAMLLNASIPILSFPKTHARYLTSDATLTALKDMLRALGKLCGEQSLQMVEWFVQTGQVSRLEHRAGALWCACRLLEGLADVSLDSHTNNASMASSTSVERFARIMAGRISTDWDAFTVEEVDDLNGSPDRVDDTIVVEQIKGLNPLVMRIDKTLDSGKTEDSGASESAITAMQLQLLTILSAILGSRSSPIFMYSMYDVLRAALSPLPNVSATANAALQSIAFNASYPSVSNCLLSNFDYILNGVSQRLTRRRLDVDAPRILGLVISLVGKEVLARASDILEECFERLDDYHGYDVILERILEVLGAVIQTIQSNWSSAGPRHSPSVTTDKRPSRLTFLTWYDKRTGDAKHSSEDLDDPRGNTSIPSSSGQDLDQSSPQPPPPSDKANEIHISLCSKIMLKAINFLTHDSSMVRREVIEILTTCSALLPESTLLPIVHKAWPYIMNRLSDTQPIMVASAAAFIERVAEVAGSFIASRLWEDVWPRFKTLLMQLELKNSQSAINVFVPSSQSKHPYQSIHNTVYRLYGAILRTVDVGIAVTRVPNDSLWEVAVLFLPFLNADMHPDLKRIAMRLYSTIRTVSGDTCWLALNAMVSDPRVHNDLNFITMQTGSIGAAETILAGAN